ncbi:MAG: hypothetical protein ACHRXM_08470 [Isosphaerales bacterium]
MSKPKVYADFQNLDDSNRLRLTCAGTIEDLARHRIELREGLVLTFYMDDADDQGEPDELRTEGVVHYDECECSWVASVDWSAIRHTSDEGKSITDALRSPDPAPTSENGATSQGSGPPSPSAKLSGQAKGFAPT